MSDEKPRADCAVCNGTGFAFGRDEPCDCVEPAQENGHDARSRCGAIVGQTWRAEPHFPGGSGLWRVIRILDNAPKTPVYVAENLTEERAIAIAALPLLVEVLAGKLELADGGTQWGRCDACGEKDVQQVKVGGRWLCTPCVDDAARAALEKAGIK